jgi:hypothetical protein
VRATDSWELLGSSETYTLETGMSTPASESEEKAMSPFMKKLAVSGLVATTLSLGLAASTEPAAAFHGGGGFHGGGWHGGGWHGGGWHGGGWRGGYGYGRGWGWGGAGLGLGLAAGALAAPYYYGGGYGYPCGYYYRCGGYYGYPYYPY